MLMAVSKPRVDWQVCGRVLTDDKTRSRAVINVSPGTTRQVPTTIRINYAALLHEQSLCKVLWLTVSEGDKHGLIVEYNFVVWRYVGAELYLCNGTSNFVALNSLDECCAGPMQSSGS